MSLHFRPRSNEERASVCLSATAYVSRPDTHPVVLELIKQSLLPCCDEWKKLRAAYVQADAAWNTAGHAVEQARGQLLAHFEPVVWSVRSCHDAPVPGVWDELIGCTPGLLARKSMMEQFYRISELLTALPRRADLHYNAERLQQLSVANAALEQSLSARAAAQKQRNSVRDALAKAESRIDAATGQISRVIAALLGEEAVDTILTGFVRAESKAARGAPEPAPPPT